MLSVIWTDVWTIVFPSSHLTTASFPKRKLKVQFYEDLSFEYLEYYQKRENKMKMKICFNTIVFITSAGKNEWL